MNKKGQSFGLIAGLVGGIAALVITIIIAFTVVGTMEGSKIIPQSSYFATNESGPTETTIVHANGSGHSVTGVAGRRNSGSFALTNCFAEYYQSNGSSAWVTTTYGGYNVTLTSTNCSISSAGNLSGGSPTYNFANVSVSYTYVGDNEQILAAGNMTSNFSSGVQNISSKVPTILLIAAVILILAVLAILIALWQRMRLGGGGNL